MCTPGALTLALVFARKSRPRNRPRPAGVGYKRRKAGPGVARRTSPRRLPNPPSVRRPGLRDPGRKISFLRFMAYGIPVTLISLAVATPYVLLRYYL